MSLAQLACPDLEFNYSQSKNQKLTRQEKLELICSVLSGVGGKANFDYETMKSRIQQCLSLAETIL